MFVLFKSKDPQVKVIDKVWISQSGKLNACRQMAQANPSTIFIAWFEETRNEILATLPESVVLLAKDASADSVRNKLVVFVEHHPLVDEEQSVYKRLYLKEAPGLSALDEPFFMKFGGERLIDVMKKMGMNEDEVIGHSMITKSIRRAQEKIGKNVRSGRIDAPSQGQWLVANLSAL